MPKNEISFIIPAYNAAATIEQAIRSIEVMIPDAEIIVVENGSTDHTYDIVRELSDMYPNIILIQSEKGVSAARNAGIRKASGNWIIFVDADDCWIGNQKILHRLIKNRVDLIICSYQKGKTRVVHNCSSVDVTEVKSWMMSKPTQRMTVWAKIYRRDFLIDHNLYFNTSLWVTEDSEFLVRCMNVCHAIFVTPDIIYDNHLEESSVTRSATEGRTEGHLDAIRVVQNEVPQDDVFRDYVLAHVNLIAVHEIFDIAIKCSWAERIRKLKIFLREDIIRSQVNKVRFSTNLQLLPSFLFKHRLYSLGGIICCLRSVSNRRAYIK